MDYSILIASIKSEIVPTRNLFKPTKRLTTYTSDATITTFDDKSSAIAYAATFWPCDTVVVIPSNRKSLEVYEQLMMGIDEECFQDYKRIADSLLTGDLDWENAFTDWEYDQDDYDMLEQAISDFEDESRGDPIADGTQPKVGSWAMDASSLLWFDASTSFVLGHESIDIEYEDLAEYVQQYITTDDTKGKAIITISMGAAFDIWCLQKFNGNIHLASIYANAIAIRSTLSMKRYSMKSKIEDTVGDIIEQINRLRMKYGWI